MAREDLHFRLRLPEGLKARIEAAAAEQRRSMTAEIVARLDASFMDYLTLSGEGLSQTLKSAWALNEALMQMMYFVRDVELDGYIADMARTGHFLSREQAIAKIVREYLAERGYVYEAPERRPGLEGINFGEGPFTKIKALMGTELGPVIADPQMAQPIAHALEQAAKEAVTAKLAELETEGMLRLPRYPDLHSMDEKAHPKKARPNIVKPRRKIRLDGK